MKKERHSKIIEIMQSKNVISVKELAEMLNCTEMTVRRNLTELEEMNFVKREHGYATLLQTAQATDYYTEIGENTKEKIAIAKAALLFIQPNMNLALDSGTTIQQLVEIFPKEMPLSVITISLTAAMTLSHFDQIQVLIPSGIMHHHNRSILVNDPDSLTPYQADIAFLSCRSLRIPAGAFEHSQTLTASKKAIAAIAERKILLADYTKWDINSLCPTIPLDKLDIIITDDKAPENSIQRAAETGKEIVVADASKNRILRHYNPSKEDFTNRILD